MRRFVLTAVASAVVVAVVVYVVAPRTYWDDVTVPLPPTGEALTNPFYAAQRLVEALNVRASRDQLFTPPPANAVIILSRWNWNLSSRRREALERWVESGGRLVIDETVSLGPEFVQWAGIAYNTHDEDKARPPADLHCARFQEQRSRPTPAFSEETHWLCDFDETTFLSSRDVDWALSSERYYRQAIRVPIGRGFVTLINARPFEYRAIFDGNHAWLLVAAAQLKRGDEVHFLSEGEHPSLLSLVWQYGAPAVWLGLITLGLLLWRGGIRFGPLAPPDVLMRRSLAEQIRGTGRFAFRHDAGESLHDATVRALEDAARRRVPGYGGLAPLDRAEALADAGGVSHDVLAGALYYPGRRRPADVRGAIARLETIRRTILRRPTRTLNGTE
jgi:hypothetical protein